MRARADRIRELPVELYRDVLLHARAAENTAWRATDRIGPHHGRVAELTLLATDKVTARLALYGDAAGSS